MAKINALLKFLAPNIFSSRVAWWGFEEMLLDRLIWPVYLTIIGRKMLFGAWQAENSELPMVSV